MSYRHVIYTLDISITEEVVWDMSVEQGYGHYDGPGSAGGA